MYGLVRPSWPIDRVAEQRMRMWVWDGCSAGERDGNIYGVSMARHWTMCSVPMSVEVGFQTFIGQSYTFLLLNHGKTPQLAHALQDCIV